MTVKDQILKTALNICNEKITFIIPTFDPLEKDDHFDIRFKLVPMNSDFYFYLHEVEVNHIILICKVPGLIISFDNHDYPSFNDLFNDLCKYFNIKRS